MALDAARVRTTHYATMDAVAVLDVFREKWHPVKRVLEELDLNDRDERAVGDFIDLLDVLFEQTAPA